MEKYTQIDRPYLHSTTRAEGCTENRVKRCLVDLDRAYLSRLSGWAFLVRKRPAPLASVAMNMFTARQAASAGGCPPGTQAQ